MSGERKAVNDVNVPYVAFSEGYKHPGNLVETRNLHYAKKTLPSYTIRNEKVKTYLSDAQLDAVAMACESFEKLLPSGHRQGFWLGDGAGVGKNRSICGIIAEIMYCQSRERSEKLHAQKAILITCSNALFAQTENDLMELDVKEPLFMLDNRYESVEIGKTHGILYTTYAMLITSGAQLEQMVKWLGANFEGLIVFDDYHTAKRYSVNQQDSAITVDKVVELQNSFPKARILYSSSTGLSTFTTVGYLQRLGLYGITHITRGVSAMELLEAELRAKGILIARTLSMEDVVFNRLECHIDAALFNESTLIWSMIYQYIKAYDWNVDINVTRFWLARQRYFADLIVSCKINPVVERAKLELLNDKAIVIGLQSTGEARLRSSVSKNNLKEEDQFCVAREILLEVLKKIVKINIDEDEPAISDSKVKEIQSLHNEGEDDAILHWVQSEWDFLPPPNIINRIKKSNVGENYQSEDNLLLEKIRLNARSSYITMLRKKIAKKFKLIAGMFKLVPDDDFVEKLGGENVVAELTGRSNKREWQCDSNSENYSRNSQFENMTDYASFMAGKKKVAIISKAFSAGVSLHNEILDHPGFGGARVHVAVEFLWRPEQVIQQFGRTHRSNQIQPPTYLLAVSNVPVEERFLATITEKLKKLGVLTMADEWASDFATHISEIDCDKKTWMNAIDNYINLLQTLAKQVPRYKLTLKVLQLVDVVRYTAGKYIVNPVSEVPTQFLNILMGIPIMMQQYVLYEISNAIDDQRRNTKDFDFGIIEYELGDGVLAKIMDKRTFDLKDGNIIDLHRIEIDKSFPLRFAKETIKSKPDVQFMNTSSGPAILFPQLDGTFLVYRPHECVASTIYGFEQRCLKPIPQMLLEKLWKRQVRVMVKSPGQCAHHYIHGECEYRDCSNKDVAKYEIYVLTGPLSLSLVWEDVRKAVFGNSYLKAIRLSATNGARETEKLIGVKIPAWTLPSLYEKLNAVLNA